jgi:nucleotide-binding universal stress UspA family protein
MYTRILVPLDGSERALAALGPARRLARLHGAELGVVTVAGPASTVEEATRSSRRAVRRPVNPSGRASSCEARTLHQRSPASIGSIQRRCCA